MKSGESMEPMQEVPLIQLGEAELERLVRGWRRGAGSWFQRRGEAAGPLETHFSAVLKQIAVSVTVPLTVEWSFTMEHHIEATDGYDTAMYLSIAPAIEPTTKVQKEKMKIKPDQQGNMR